MLTLHCVCRGFHRDDDFQRIDLKESRYAGYGTLYVFQGILDAVTQNWACELVAPCSFPPQPKCNITRNSLKLNDCTNPPPLAQIG